MGLQEFQQKYLDDLAPGTPVLYDCRDFKDGKVTHEHIYWDQASVLVQIGLLDPKGLPVYGIETAQQMEKILNK